MNAQRVLACVAIGVFCGVDVSSETSTEQSACEPQRLHKLLLDKHQELIWNSLHRIRVLHDTCWPTEHRGWYAAYRAQAESFVGNYKLALSLMDSRRAGAPPAQGSTLLPRRIRGVSAVSHVVRKAKNTQVVIVNERHHAPADRILTLELLRPLARQGYRYLALEAAATDVAEPGESAVASSGYYINDVVFGALWQEATKMGFSIVPYEAEADQERPEARAGRSTHENREFWQASNLVSRIFDGDPAAKVIVHCGYSHLDERKERRWMASILKEQTKIDPLTVDQTILSERSSSEFEHPIRREAVARGLLDSGPIVLTENTGKAFDIGIGAGADVHVVGLETKYADGRPTWMQLGARRRPMRMDTPECAQTRCIVEARGNRGADAVPYDRVEVINRSNATLYLPSHSVPVVRIKLFDQATAQLLGERNIVLAAREDVRH